MTSSQPWKGQDSHATRPVQHSAGGPAPFTPAEARAFALAMTYATAALAYASEHYPDFRAWCLAQPSSPDPRLARMEEFRVLLAEAAGAAWEHAGVKPPGGLG